jgi:hypothetical protein
MEEKKNIQFTIEQIRKYLNGELSGPDMHELEKAALDDPFLADAMEGFELSRKPSGSLETDLAFLKNRLMERTSKKKRSNRLLVQMRWPVAASVLVIAGATLFTFMYLTRKINADKISKSDIRNNLAKKIQSLPKAAADSIDSMSKNRSIINKQSYSGLTTRNNMQRGISRNQEEKKSPPSAAQIFPSYDDTIPHPDLNENNDHYDKETPHVAVLSPAETLSGKAAGVEVMRRQNSFKQLVSKKYISGIIVNEKREPIQNATVSLSNSEKRATTTDSNGYFKLYLNNSESTGHIVINSVGYQTISTRLRADSSLDNRIELQPLSMALNEVVVTGYGSPEESESNNRGSGEFSKNKDLFSNLPDSVVNKHAAPIPGWKAYDVYLHQAIKILSADSLLRGSEIVTFQVNSKGEMSNFKIIESLSAAHDAEMIRLIKEGPGWKINKGKKRTCRVSLQLK